MPASRYNDTGVAARFRDEAESLRAEISRLESENEVSRAEISRLKLETKENEASLVNPDSQADERTTLKRLISQVETGFLRRSNEHVKDIFERFSQVIEGKGSDQGIRVLQKEKLMEALDALGVVLFEGNDLDAILTAVDLNNDGVLDMEEFKHVLELPIPQMEWIRGLPLAELLWDAIPKEKETILFRTVANMTPNVVDNVASAFKHGIVKLFLQQCPIAKAACEVKSEENSAASKFQVNALNCGSIEDFHAGLLDRIGNPSLRFDAAMESEHCRKAGCNFTFTTSNYNVTTTPADEWAITVKSEFSKADMGHGRKLAPIDSLMKLTLVIESKLVKDEVIAVVLYTGPMYVIFNAILRRYPEGIYKVFAEGDNLFTTTISVLVSSVQKVSRTVKLPEGLKLLRGLGGTNDLPASFYKAHTQGCRGFAEWGFMSTTSSKETAMLYSGVRDGKPLAMVLEADTGAVSRGACIRDLSQYPGEIEYLLPPCSFVEPAGPPWLEVTPHGPVTVVPVKLFPNIKTLTLEGLLAQKKDTHLAAFRFVLGQIREEIEDMAQKSDLGARIAKDPWRIEAGVTYTSEMFRKRITEQCEEFFTRQKQRQPSEFTDDETFRGMVVEMLDVKTMATAKLQFYLVDKSALMCYVYNMPLRAAYRAMLAFSRRTLPSGAEERQKAAAEMCRLEGLMHEGVNELGEPRIVSAAAEGLSGTRLHLLLAAGTKLSDVDQKGNTALHLASRYGQMESLQALVAQKADVNASNKELWTALFMAADNGQTEAVRMLISSNAAVDSENESKWTALTAASEGGHLEAVRVLVEAKADVLSRVDDGATPLFMAAQNGHVECVRALLESKADVDAAKQTGATALHLAAQNGHLECVRALVDSKAAFDASKQTGATAVYVATDKGHVECLRVLVESKAAVDAAQKDGWRPLFAAAYDGRTECLGVLLQYRADVNAKLPSGETALYLAMQEGHTECAELLRAAAGT